MAAALIIVFREVLEASLIIGIVLAGTKGIAGRRLWVSTGVGGGVLGALVVAAFAGAIASALSGIGQEVFNAAILFTAVAMLGWHNIWMTRHGRELASTTNEISSQVSSGQRPLYAIAVVCGLAVMREGSEIVLFLYGVAASGASGRDMLLGGLGGLGLGVVFGAVIYLGLVTIPLRYLFSVTSALILFLAAGMAAKGASFLTQAGILPSLGTDLWDSSAFLSERGIIGQVCHILLGYVARPSGIQLVFYIGTLAVIGSFMWLLREPPRVKVKPRETGTVTPS